jgi:ribosomal protein S18 acetylase RimI-like enzyme
LTSRGGDALVLREARASDAATVAALHAASWRATYRGVLADRWLDEQAATDRLALWRERLDTPSSGQQVLLALAPDGTLAGFACTFAPSHPAWGSLLENLHVAASHRGRGLGERLLREAARWSDAASPGQPFHLSVVDRNAPAQRFYRRLGATAFGQETWNAPDGGTVVCDVLGWARASELS